MKAALCLANSKTKSLCPFLWTSLLMCYDAGTHAIIFFLTAGLGAASLLLPLNKTLIQIAHKEWWVISLLHCLIDVILDLVKDICAFVPHQSLLDLLIQSFLHWDLPTLYKVVLVDFTYQLWHLTLYGKRKHNKKKSKNLVQELFVWATCPVVMFIGD